MGASIREIDNQIYNGLKIWDAASSKLIAEKKPYTWYPVSLSFSPDGEKVLVTGHTSIIIDPKTGLSLQELNTCPYCDISPAVIWAPDSNQLLVQKDNDLGLYDLTTQSWKTETLTSYLGSPYEWLDDDGNVLFTGKGVPTVVNVSNGEVKSLLEYFKASQ